MPALVPAPDSGNEQSADDRGEMGTSNSREVPYLTIGESSTTRTVLSMGAGLLWTLAEVVTL